MRCVFHPYPSCAAVSGDATRKCGETRSLRGFGMSFGVRRVTLER